MNKFLIGSKYFFSCYADFQSKDHDEIEIVETNEFSHLRQLTGQGKCVFQLRKKSSLEGYLDWDLTSNVPMGVGKYLIPEFAHAIGFTVEDLPKLKPMINRLVEKHKYEAIIYDSYILNGSFTLTDEQRQRAYKSYKESRAQ